MRITNLMAMGWLAMGSGVQAGEWPQFLGPARNAVYVGESLAEAWPKEGPPVVWRASVGQGFSGPVVAAGKVVLFHRVGDEERVEGLEADTGKKLWSFGYPTGYRDRIVGEDHGPRATPAIAEGKVYTLGAEGALHCLDLADGRRLWNLDARAAFVADQGFFGFAGSPLVEGELVLLNIGGAAGAGIVALDRNSGKLRWKATDDEASYSSPITAVIDHQRLALFLTRAGLVGLNPVTGAVKYRFPWRSRMLASVNAATPVVVDGRIFISASYQTGAVLLRPEAGKLEPVWSGDDILSNHYATSIHHRGYLFGFDGRQEYGPRLRCVEYSTGKVRWTQEGQGAGVMLLAGDHLLILLESGVLLQVDTDPDHYRELARAQILGSGTRAQPALVNGLLYARGRDRLVCIDLRKH